MHTELQFLDNLLKNNDTVVVACSGGPDSMCLLNLLLQLKIPKKLNLICAHINHKQRKESTDEWIYVKDFCQKNNIIFEGMEINSYTQRNFHNEAHQKRKKFYEELVLKYHAKYLMTGHHGDDLIETILMRITRGSSINGYKGFSKIQNEHNYQVVRPLITTTKEKIKEYNINKNITYFIDKSNEKDKYTRNRYRHYVLPFLKSENQNVHLKFLKFNEELCRINEFIVKFTKDALTKCLDFDTLHIVEMRKYEELIQREIIKEYLHSIFKEDIILLNDIHIENVLKLIHTQKSYQEISLPNNWKAKKRYNELKVEKDVKESYKVIELNDSVCFSNGDSIKKLESSDEKNNYVIRLNSKELVFPLEIRHRNYNSKIEVKNDQGHQKVNRIFIDKKIPKDKRDSWPILVDQTGQVLWIPGVKKSKFDKEINEKYDIIYKYNLSKEKNYATKK